MDQQWKYQLRIDLADVVAEAARRDPDDPALGPLPAILRRHHAVLKCQYDAFADYVAEAEKHGTEKYPLYLWTKDTIAQPAKQQKYRKSFTLYVDGEECRRLDGLQTPVSDRTEILVVPSVAGG